MAKYNRRKAERERIARQNAYQKEAKKRKKILADNNKYTEQYNRAAIKRGGEPVDLLTPYQIKKGKIVFDPSFSKQAWREAEKKYLSFNKYYNVPLYSIDTLSNKATEIGVDKPLFSLAEQKKLGKSDVFMITEAINKQLDYIRPRNGADGHNISRAGGKFLQTSADTIFSYIQSGIEMGGGDYNPDRKDNPLYMASDFRFDSEEFEKGFQSLSDSDQGKVMRELIRMAGNPYGDEKSYDTMLLHKRSEEGEIANMNQLVHLKNALDASSVWRAVLSVDYDSDQQRDDVYEVLNNQSKLNDDEIDTFRQEFINSDKDALEFLEKHFNMTKASERRKPKSK